MNTVPPAARPATWEPVPPTLAIGRPDQQLSELVFKARALVQAAYSLADRASGISRTSSLMPDGLLTVLTHAEELLVMAEHIADRLPRIDPDTMRDDELLPFRVVRRGQPPGSGKEA